MCNLCSNPSLQFLNCSPMKINWIPSCNQWMCKVLYQQCSRTICQACSMVLFHLYLGFLCHNQLWWCGTRDFKKSKGGRENDIVAKISQDLPQIQAKILSQNIWACHVESSLLEFCPFSCLEHQTSNITWNVEETEGRCFCKHKADFYECKSSTFRQGLNFLKRGLV